MNKFHCDDRLLDVDYFIQHGGEVQPIGEVSKGWSVPQKLSQSRPYYGFGKKLYSLQFASNEDKALYIVGGKTQQRDVQYVQWLQQQMPWATEDDIQQMARQVRSRIKNLAVYQTSDGGTIQVPETANVEKRLRKAMSKFNLPRLAIARFNNGLQKLAIGSNQPIGKDWQEDQHPRTGAGQEGGGRFAPKDTADVATPASQAAGTQPSSPSNKKHGGAGTKEDPFYTSDVKEAAKLLGEGKSVKLESKAQISTLMTELKALVDDAVSKGEKAPLYDLCKVTVEDSSLFCVESKGIPRIQMPQLAGKPLPGSKADTLPKDKKGEVDITSQFIVHLAVSGAQLTGGPVPACFLKATQNELKGEKVSGMAVALAGGKADAIRTTPILVSADNYILDGHHRWAATVAVDLQDGHEGDLMMNTVRVNKDIIDLLAIANDFAADWGIPPSDVNKSMTCVVCNKGQNVPLNLAKAVDWNEQLHPRAEDGRFGDKPGAPTTAAQPTGDIPVTTEVVQSALGQAMSGGFTVSALGEVPVKGFAMSPYKDREFVDGDKLRAGDVLNFISKNRDLLAKANHFIGGWLNKAENRFYLDVSLVLEDQQAALDEGDRRQQIKIFDLGKGEEMFTNWGRQYAGAAKAAKPPVHLVLLDPRSQQLAADIQEFVAQLNGKTE